MDAHLYREFSQKKLFRLSSIAAVKWHFPHSVKDKANCRVALLKSNGVTFFTLLRSKLLRTSLLKKTVTHLMCKILNPLLDLPGDLAEAGRQVSHKLNQVFHCLYDLSHGEVVQHLFTVFDYLTHLKQENKDESILYNAKHKVSCWSIITEALQSRSSKQICRRAPIRQRNKQNLIIK